MQGHQPRTVRDLMTENVVTLGRNEKLSIADDVMNLGRIRHLPVLDDDGRLSGIISQRDLFHSALSIALGVGSTGRNKLMATILIKEIMTTSPRTVTADTPLHEAARLMFDRKIGCLPVLQSADPDSPLVGILTESDFVRLHAQGPDPD